MQEEHVINSDPPPRTLPPCTSYLRVQSPLCSFPAPRCQMWFPPDPPGSHPCHILQQGKRRDFSCVSAELAPWTCFRVSCLQAVCNQGCCYPPCSSASPLQVSLLPVGSAQVRMPLNSKTGFTAGSGNSCFQAGQTWRQSSLEESLLSTLGFMPTSVAPWHSPADRPPGLVLGSKEQYLHLPAYKPLFFKISNPY